MTARRLLGAVVAVIILLLVGFVLYLVLARAPISLEPRGAARAPSPSPVVSGWYDLYFSQPRYPDRPENHQGGIDERLVALIDSAQSTIDIAIYDFDLANVAAALTRAAERGVRVRMVTDTDTFTDTKNEEIQAAFTRVKDAGIPIVEDDRSAIMHNKFVVVDGRTVLTGSWNFTVGDTYRLNNHAVVIRSPELAANYTSKFESMFTNKLFGPNKPAGVPNPVVTVNGTRIANYFAPEDQVAKKVIDRLRRARSSVRFLAFSFTHDGIGDVLLDLHRQGVAVEGVFETTGSETRFSEMGRLKEAGIPVWQDGNPYVMHHKVFIIDNEAVILGSFNFSNNADESNDENLLIIENPAIAQAFTEEYQRIKEQAQNPPARKR